MRRKEEIRIRKNLMILILTLVVLASVPMPVKGASSSDEYRDCNQITRKIIKPKKMKVYDIRKTKVVYMHSGEQVQFTAGGKAIWKSENKSKVTINSKGIVTVKDYGIYTDESTYIGHHDVMVTAKQNGKTYSCHVIAFPLYIYAPGYWFSSVGKIKYIRVVAHKIDFPNPYVVADGEYNDFEKEKMTISAKSSNPAVIKILTPSGCHDGIKCKVQKEGETIITVTMKTPAGYTHIFTQKVITTKKTRQSYVNALRDKWKKSNRKDYSEEEVYEKIVEFAQKKYPEGSQWTASHYYPQNGIATVAHPHTTSCGSLGFANMLSNYIYGNEYTRYDSWSNFDSSCSKVSWRIVFKKGVPLEYTSNCEVEVMYYDFPNPVTPVESIDDLRAGDILAFEDQDNPGEVNRFAVLMRKESTEDGTILYYMAEGDVNRKVTYQTVLSRGELRRLFYCGYSRNAK